MRYSWGSIIDVSIERNKSIHLELPFRRDDLPRGLYISRNGFGYDVYIGPSVLDAQSFLTLCNPMDHMEPPARLRCPWDSPGKNTGVGCHALLQGIFQTQASNP